MITLITGLPGNGKTLYLLWLVENIRRESEKDGAPPREVYYSGIRDLNLPWIEFGEAGPKSEPHMTDPSRWPELPQGSIIVIDECQRLYRPRHLTKEVPSYVAALETHRHHGYDIYLVTQHPNLVDTAVRRLTESHRHMMRKFGSTWATIHEWKGVKENCDKTRASSIETQFKYPKEVYSWYKSAEVHNVKVRVPAKVVLLLSIPFIVAVLSWLAYTQMGKSAGTEAATAPKAIPAASAPNFSTQYTKPGTVSDLVTSLPRVPNMPWTAPKYDHLMHAVAAPYPVGCVLEGEKQDTGYCFTSQGTMFWPGIDFVRGFVKRGYFVDFQRSAPQMAPQRQVKPNTGDQQALAPPGIGSAPSQMFR
jgi:zona occludens toxin